MFGIYDSINYGNTARTRCKNEICLMSTIKNTRTTNCLDFWRQINFTHVLVFLLLALNMLRCTEKSLAFQTHYFHVRFLYKLIVLCEFMARCHLHQLFVIFVLYSSLFFSFGKERFRNNSGSIWVRVVCPTLSFSRERPLSYRNQPIGL